MSYEQSFQWFYYVRLQEYQKVDITNGLRREKIHRLKRSGMIVEEKEGNFIYNCNDFGFETNFDDLVFSIEKL